MTVDMATEGDFLGAASATWPARASDAALGWPVAGRRQAISVSTPHASCGGLASAPTTAAQASVAARVESALVAAQGPRAPERRSAPRFPYPYPVYLTPLDAQGRPLSGQTLVVIGRHLSPQGLDFYCTCPLADRRVIASLDGREAGWLGFVLELTWCRYSRHRWYEHGGRFVTVANSPLATAAGQGI